MSYLPISSFFIFLECRDGVRRRKSDASERRRTGAARMMIGGAKMIMTAANKMMTANRRMGRSGGRRRTMSAAVRSRPLPYPPGA